MRSTPGGTKTAVGAALFAAPVLYVAAPTAVDGRELLLSSLPQAEDALVVGADDSLAISHPDAIASSLAAFVQRHPTRRRKLSA